MGSISPRQASCRASAHEHIDPSKIRRHRARPARSLTPTRSPTSSAAARRALPRPGRRKAHRLQS